MLVVSLEDGGEIDVFTAILLPALGTYDGRLVLVTAISCYTTQTFTRVILSIADSNINAFC